MKFIQTIVTIALMSLSFSAGALANGQGTPVEPAENPVTLEPSGPAPGEAQSAAQSGQNWWLIALSAAVAIGIIVALSDDDDDTN